MASGAGQETKNALSTDSDRASTGEPARQEHQLRHATLGTSGVAFFVISAAAPLTAMAGGAPVAMLLGNGGSKAL